MNEIIDFLASQVRTKLEDTGISENAKSILTTIGLELDEMSVRVWSIDNIDEANDKIQSMGKRLNKLTKEEPCLETKS